MIRRPAPVERKQTRGALDATALNGAIGYLATRAEIRLRRAFFRGNAGLELRPVEFSLLALLAANSRATQKQLGRALEVSAPNMAVVLERMEERKWIRRARNPEDRREHFVEITPAGRKLADQSMARTLQAEEGFLRRLTHAERQLLAELLQKIGD
jgi:DNA-binding MarR family transcriptional regulator